MFTGIVEEIGTVKWLKMSPKGTVLRLSAPPELIKSQSIGDSLAVDGCCLTITSIRDGDLKFDVLEETLRATALGALRNGAQVNLERPLGAGGRFGGHFVQGHVDICAKVISHTKHDDDTRLEVELPEQFSTLVVYKGSIAINGVSLTVAECNPGSFSVWLIPHTRAVTNLGQLSAGDPVNLEFDMLAKYIDRMLEARLGDGGIQLASKPLPGSQD